MPPERSEILRPPDDFLGTVNPSIAIPNPVNLARLSNDRFAGRVYRFDLANSIFQEITVDAPSMLRLQSTSNTATGEIFAPTAGEGIFYTAWPKGTANSAQDPRYRRSIRSTGPLLYLPAAGTYQLEFWVVQVTSTIVPVIQNVELAAFEMSAEVASAYLSLPPSTRVFSNQFTIAAGTGGNLFAAGRLDLSTVIGMNWFALTFLRIQVNTTPVVGLRFAVGRFAAAAQGAETGGFVGRTYNWQELAGNVVTIFNGSAAPADFYAEAHFL